MFSVAISETLFRAMSRIEHADCRTIPGETPKPFVLNALLPLWMREIIPRVPQFSSKTANCLLGIQLYVLRLACGRASLPDFLLPTRVRLYGITVKQHTTPNNHSFVNHPSNGRKRPPSGIHSSTSC